MCVRARVHICVGVCVCVCVCVLSLLYCYVVKNIVRITLCHNKLFDNARFEWFLLL